MPYLFQSHLFQDLRFALRLLVKTPLVTAAALISLALGLGATTTIFTLINAFFLRGVVTEQADRVAMVFVTSENPKFSQMLLMSHPTFLDLEQRTQVFSDLMEIAFAPADLVGAGGEAEQVAGQMVTANFFQLLGSRPLTGRYFRPDENGAPGAHPVVVLSHGFWDRRFAADPAIVGKTISLNGQAFTVIGVAPRGFRGTLLLIDPHFWVPLSMYETFQAPDSRKWVTDRFRVQTRAYGRLAPGVSMAQARSAVEVLGTALAKEYPGDLQGMGLTLLPLPEATVPPEQRAQLLGVGKLLLGAVLAVLLIACGNVANLLLARARSRRREVAVRLALGASRGRLVAQLLTESLLLSLVAGGLGLLFAFWARGALWNQRPPMLASAPLDLSFDSKVLTFTLLLTLATGLLFGLAPAIQSTRPALVEGLKAQSDSIPGATRLLSLKNLLVALQMAFCLLALIGCGLFLRSLSKASRVDLGVDAGRLASLRVDLTRQRLDPATAAERFDRIVETARRVPGVSSAALVSAVPMDSVPQRQTVIPEGQNPTDPRLQAVLPTIAITEPGFLRTAGIELFEGRDFEPTDQATTTPVVLVSRAAAEFFWPGERALGKRLQVRGQPTLWEVIGVVEDVVGIAVGEATPPQLYVTRRQRPIPSLALLLRSDGEVEGMLGRVRGEIQRLDPGLPITQVATLASRVRQSLWASRMLANLLGLLGGLGLVLAAIGIYGVTAYSVAQRGREIGIRTAMGATPGRVKQLIVGQGALIVALGLGVGLVLAVVISQLAGRALTAQLYGVGAVDLLTYFATSVILAAVALAANYLPARKASQINPVSVLTFER